ncbi:MAG: hypothetical protein J3Q66DRAFT_394085 [Benniella sp.]|nr:MAG: hypothetical protein J3Q66DRAFT_394085 [Benniella sp.]
MSKITPQRSSARSISAKKPSLPAILVLAAMLFNVMVSIVAAKSTLMSGESLKNGEYLESPDGSKRFVVEDGKAIIRQKGIRDLQTWLLTSKNDQGSDPTQYSLRLNDRGMLSGLDGNGQLKSSIRHVWSGQRVGSWELSLWDSGLLYLKNPDGYVVWNNICDNIWSILSSTSVFEGACIVSPDHGSLLYMKKNGNLVLYKGYTPFCCFGRPADKKPKSFSGYHWLEGLFGFKIFSAQGFVLRRDNPGPSTVYLHLSRTGTLKIYDYKFKEEYIIHDNDKPGVKQGTYYLRITDEPRIQIVDNEGIQVALI